MLPTSERKMYLIYSYLSHLLPLLTGGNWTWSSLQGSPFQSCPCMVEDWFDTWSEKCGHWQFYCHINMGQSLYRVLALCSTPIFLPTCKTTMTARRLLQVAARVSHSRNVWSTLATHRRKSSSWNLSRAKDPQVASRDWHVTLSNLCRDAGA